MGDRPTVVVTGFGPFGDHVKNASWEAVKLLPSMHVEDEFDVRLVTEEIPVTYEDVDVVVPQLWKKYEPILMVHVGVSRIAEFLTVESCANKSGYCKKDAKKCVLSSEINPSGAEEHLITNFDLNKIKLEAELHSVDLCISVDAGRYLCEYIYYTSLNISSNTIFIHVPMITDELPASKIAQQIKLILKLVLKQLREVVNRGGERETL